MKISSKISYLIKQIRESEHWWKANYHATWKTSKTIKEEFESSDKWKLPHTRSLPASRNGSHMYPSVEFFNYILTHRDGEIALNHTTRILSLLEKLVKEAHKYLYPDDETLYTANQENLIRFLKWKGFLKNDEENELRLALQTRNCVVHNGTEADDKYMSILQKTKDRDSEEVKKVNETVTVCSSLYWLEDWHNLLLRITERLEKHILSL